MNLKQVCLIILSWGLSGILFAFPLEDARNLALGGMAVASADTPSAIFINPAILTRTQELETSFTQTRLALDDFDFGFSVDFPLVKGEVGFGVGWSSVADQNQALTGVVRDQNGQIIIDPSTGQPLTQVLGFYTQNNNTVYASLAAKADFLSFGANLKFFLTDFGGLEGTGFGADVSAEAYFDQSLAWGATCFDLGNSVVDFHGGTPNLVTPASWMTSLYWKFLKSGSFSVSMEPGASEEFQEGAPFNWGVGLEGAWRNSIFLRAGGGSNQTGIGLGLVAHPGKIFREVRVDYTYLTQAPDGYPSRLTLSVGW